MIEILAVEMKVIEGGREGGYLCPSRTPFQLGIFSLSSGIQNHCLDRTRLAPMTSLA